MIRQVPLVEPARATNTFDVANGVKNGSRGLAARCLLYLGERTSSGCLGMSDKCPGS